MAEILRQNYPTTLPKLFDSIRESDFISIDINLEMNGLITRSEKLDNWLLRPSWYKNLEERQHIYNVYELGLALFKSRRTVTEEVYDVQCLNIPLLCPVFEDPMKRVSDTAKHRVNYFGPGLGLMQWKKYDLNKMLYDGVPFMNEERQNEALLYMKKYPDFLCHQSKTKQYIVDKHYFPEMISYFGPDETKEAIDRLRGISKLIDVISETKKPVVGHNLQIKLPLLFKDMVALLPKDFDSYQVRLDSLMPQVYDTKFMAWNMKQSSKSSEWTELLKSHCLYDLYFNFGTMRKKLICTVLDENSKIYEVDLKDGLEMNIVDDENSLCYESGFDACVAGTVFLNIAHLYSDSDVAGMKSRSLSDIFTKCEPFKNQFFYHHIHMDDKN